MRREVRLRGKRMQMRTLMRRGWVWDLAADLIGGICYAVGIYIFAKHAGFAPGGVSGLALLLDHLFGLPVGLGTLLLNLPLFALSYRFVGRQFLIKTLRSTMICVLFLDVVFPRFPAYTGDPFLAALFSGVFLGTGLALFYMRGSSSGGMDLLTMSVKALRPHLSIGMVMLSMDMVVILLGWPVFGSVDAVLYGLTATAVNAVVLDKIMYGAGACKLVIIITDAGREIAGQIAARCARGSTMIRATGTYTGMERHILLCACGKAEAYKVRAAAHEIDADAFVMVTETSEVFGEGFADPRGNIPMP